MVFRVLGLGFRALASEPSFQGSGVQLRVLRSWALSFLGFKDGGFRVWGFRVPGLVFGVYGLVESSRKFGALGFLELSEARGVCACRLSGL